MKPLLVGLLLLLAGPVGPIAQSKSTTPQAEEERVIAATAAFWDFASQKTCNEKEWLNRVPDDVLMVNITARFFTKATLRSDFFGTMPAAGRVAYQCRPKTWKAERPSRIRIHGDTAVSHGIVDAGQGVVQQLFFYTYVLVKRNGEWQLLNMHHTLVKQRPTLP